MPTSVRWAARALVAASLLGLGAATVSACSAATSGSSTLPPSASHTTGVSPAAAGAGWIARDVSSTGAVIDAISHKASAGDTADAVLALVAARFGSNQVTAATHWLEHHFGSYVAPSGIDSPGSLGLLILAAVAAGASPTRFGGTSPSNNLVARLLATERLTGKSAGVFGAPKSANAFSQALALLALDAVKRIGARTQLGETFLARQQCTDGGWEFVRPSLTVGCVAPNPKTYSGPDTNSTALAVMAIVGLGGKFAHSPVAFFKQAQESNAEFGYYGTAGDGQPGDTDSTAESLQALIALGVSKNAEFIRNGITPTNALARLQYRCTAPPALRGEFRYAGSPSQLATLQAVPAIAGVTLPERHVPLSAAEPRFTCTAS